MSHLITLPPTHLVYCIILTETCMLLNTICILPYMCLNQIVENTLI